MMETSLVTCTLFIQCILMLVNMTFSESCLQIPGSTCACKSSKGTIDLSPLSKPHTGKDSRFTTKIGADIKNPNAIYHYNPCIPIKAACYDDSDCAVCQQIMGYQNFSAGTQASAVMAGDPDVGQLKITYQHSIRTSIVKIICNQSQEGVFEPAPGEDPQLQYTFELRTKYGCYPAPPNPEPGHNGISIGSVLVIIFFVLLLVYIVGGMLFLRFARGAQGIEMFPNLAFWKELPFLVKDGIVFVFRGCKTDATYTKI